MLGMSELGLVTGKARGDHLVHLFHDEGQRALCSQPRRPTVPVSGFRAAPCGACLSSALDGGHAIARDTGNGFINLQRVAVPV